MSAPNHQVSVFHFTSRISSAKIRKYRMATEKGMGAAGGGNEAAVTTGTRTSRRKAASPSLTSPTTGPPAKRPRLKLNVRRPSDSRDTIAVSRPKRNGQLRIRYSENMNVDSADLDDSDEALSQSNSRRTSAASSVLSPLTPVPSLGEEPIMVKAPAPTSDKRREYGRDFMSYYVTGDDEENDAEAVSATEPAPPTSKHSLSQGPETAITIQAPPEPTQAPPVPVPPARERKPKYQQPVPQHHPPVQALPHRSMPPQPVITVIEAGSRPRARQHPDTVATMTTKVLNLSAALASFGGVPAMPESPRPVAKEAAAPPPSHRTDEENNVDSLLGMFNDADGEPKSDFETAPLHIPEVIDLQVPLQKPGEPDAPLTHGIEFIQNALRSWAIQRNISEYQMQYMQHQQYEAASRAKHLTGRSNKHENGLYEHARPPKPPPHIRIDLSQTPEGAAILAFQEVLAAGCLQVNAQLPLPLSRALRRLYMQIDQLINQGARNEPQWRCMSYGAQIAAHRSRAEKWKIMQVRTQQDFLRQQRNAQQHLIQHTGPSPQHQNLMAQQQLQLQHAVNLERKLGVQDAAPQQLLTQHPANMVGVHQKSSTPPGDPIIPASPMNPQSQHIRSSPPSLDPVNGRRVHPNKIQLHGTDLPSRSDRPKKSSFAPEPDSVQQESRCNASHAQHAAASRSDQAGKSAKVLAAVPLGTDSEDVDLTSPSESLSPVRGADTGLASEGSDRSSNQETPARSMTDRDAPWSATPTAAGAAANTQSTASKGTDAMPSCGYQEATLIDYQDPRARDISDVA